ncbi:MAG: hypothetical protein FWF49_03425 [Oscillospiraceae bacterium]|nr:hypothetical protein [Oscillospiraceae bacterium]
MTGRALLNEALYLLGYTKPTGEADGSHTGALMRRGLTAVNQIVADLYPIEHPRTPLPAVADMSRPLPLSDQACRDAAVYGVAMLLAGAEGDALNEAQQAAVYNQKRTRLPRPPERRADVLPKAR